MESASEFDVIVIGSGMGGMLGAAAIDPRVFQHFRQRRAATAHRYYAIENR